MQALPQGAFAGASFQTPAGLPEAPARTLAQSLVLAALLHLWLVLVVGNVPGGTALPGQGLWGAIDIRLGAAGAAGEADTAAPEPLPVPAGPSGAAAQPRWGGVVRADRAPPPATAAPGAQRLGVWRAAPGEAVLAETLAPVGPRSPQPDLPLQAPLPEPLPDVLPATQALPDLPALPLAAVPLSTKAMLDTLPPAAEPRPVAGELSAGPAPSLPLPLLQPLPQALSPALPPALPQALLQPPQPQPLPLPELLEVPEVPALPAMPPWPAAAVTEPVEPLEPVERVEPVLQPQLPQPQLPQLPASPPAAEVPRLAGGRDRVGPAAPPVGAPDAGYRVGVDVATPAAAAASAAPLNLRLPPRGAALSRGVTPGVLQLLPRPPEQPSQLAKDIEDAARADCRKAYGGAGLLAAAPLLRDAISGRGCKW